jgi:hypothetical protein
MKHCQWCDTQFSPKTTYQIYCSSLCREEATKEKIALRYEKTRRERRKNKDRRCKICSSALSIYNDDKTCESCVVDPKEVNRVLRQIKGMANGKVELPGGETNQDTSD